MEQQLDISSLQKELTERLNYASELLSKPTHANENMVLANATYKSLIAKIKAFENSLDSETEVGIKIINLGESKLMAVTEINYIEPNIICFNGYIDNSKAELVTHITQLNLILMGTPKNIKSQPAKRIGFSGI